ncbi:MAG: hypothetical protein P0107_01590 [Nitrosomonas sp.]|nr:hypothetical protein [Nitrosomonas sp.]
MPIRTKWCRSALQMILSGMGWQSVLQRRRMALLVSTSTGVVQLRSGEISLRKLAEHEHQPVLPNFRLNASSLLLAIDSGNTAIKWGLHDGRQWLAHGKTLQSERRRAGNKTGCVASTCIHLDCQCGRITGGK